jgi:signal transduction histidine kinase
MAGPKSQDGTKGNGFKIALLLIIALMIFIRFVEAFVYPNSQILPPDVFLALAIVQIFILWFDSAKEKERIIWVQKRKEELAEMKVKFTLITSHELMTPLTVIKGYVKLLSDKALGALTEKQQESLAVIDKYLIRLEAIKENLTRLSAASPEAIKKKRKSVSVAEIIKATADDMAPFIRKRRQALDLEIGDAIPEVVVDPADIKEVLVNLTLNAIRFTPDNGRICIRAKDSEGSVGVEVEDNGIGIPADKIEHIFESFYEAGDIKKHSSGSIEFKSSGIGLGLAIAKSIISAHGGDIRAESVPGRFSRFTFTLPK